MDLTVFLIASIELVGYLTWKKVVTTKQMQKIIQVQIMTSYWNSKAKLNKVV
jgi:hypothetical protein